MKNSRIWTWVLVYAVIIVIFALLQPDQVNWSPRYYPEGKEPYDLDLFSAMMNSRLDSVNHLSESWTDIDSSSIHASNIVLIGDYFYLDEIEQKSLKQWVSNGGVFFVATQSTYSLQLDSIAPLKESSKWIDPDSLLTGSPFRKRVKVSMNTKALENVFEIYHSGYYYTFDLDTIRPDSLYSDYAVECLSEDLDGDCIFIKLKYGKGFYLIHKFPAAFANFSIAEKDFRKYTSACLEYLPKRKTYLDVYHNNSYMREGINTSPLRVINKHLSLKIAWYILLTMGVLFLLFYGRRKQRVIPVIEPKKNKSVDFVQNIAALHYRDQRPRTMMHKRRRRLLQLLNEKFRISGIEFEDDEVNLVATKTNVNVEDVEQLWKAIRYMDQYKGMTKEKFIETNQLYNQFYKALNI